MAGLANKQVKHWRRALSAHPCAQGERQQRSAVDSLATTAKPHEHALAPELVSRKVVLAAEELEVGGMQQQSRHAGT